MDVATLAGEVEDDFDDDRGGVRVAEKRTLSCGEPARRVRAEPTNRQANDQGLADAPVVNTSV